MKAQINRLSRGSAPQHIGLFPVLRATSGEVSSPCAQGEKALTPLRGALLGRAVLKRNRGFTLLELITALILFFIIMAAVITFTSYTAETTNFTYEYASIQNEMRLMMKLIRDEVTTAQGVTIGNNMPRSALTTGNALHTMSLLAFDENNSRKTFSIEHKPAGGTNAEKVWDFNELPYLEVNFEIKLNTHNILVITLRNSDPDPRYQLTLTDELFLPNARKQLTCGRPSCVPCTCTLTQPPKILSPPGGGNSLLIISPKPAPTG